MTSRAERISARFKLIRGALEHLYGRELAFAASSAAWLMGIEEGIGEGVERVASGENAKLLEAEIRLMLQGYHEELCIYLQVDLEKSLDLSKSFQQVIYDILEGKG